MYICACSGGSSETCGEGEGRDHDDDEEEDEPVLDRFDRLDDVREVEAYGGDTGNMVSTSIHAEPIKMNKKMRFSGEWENGVKLQEDDRQGAK